MLVGVWHAQVAARALSVVDDVELAVDEALSHFGLAQSALADQDLVASAAHFTDAEATLEEARAHVEQAVTTSEALVALLDVTGAVRSGDRLLSATESIMQAGASLSAGLHKLQGGSVLEADNQKLLTHSLAAARQEFLEADAALERAEKMISDVSLFLLPERVQEHVQSLKVALPLVRAPLTFFIDESDALLAILGDTHDRHYLLLFQNNHELRPTGGFLGTLGLVRVDHGQIENVDVSTVYDPDGQLKDYIAPPTPLGRITDRWYLRDANWFVDYPTSAEEVRDFFEKEGGPTVDGVIALTPEVIRSFLAVTGPIEMPAYEVVVDEDNFIALTQEQVTYYYDREENKPKQFLADLTPTLLNRLLGSGEASHLDVITQLMRMIEQKQLLISFTNDREEHIADRLGWNGTFDADSPGLLAINNANIGGHKSDQFIEQEIDYRTEVLLDGTLEASVTIRRTHNGPTEVTGLEYPPDENPHYKDNIIWQRILVPAGAQFIEASGFASEADLPPALPIVDLPLEPDPEVAEWQRAQRLLGKTVVGQEAGATYFAHWQITRPGETTVGTVRYRIPKHFKVPTLLNPAEPIAVTVIKQPGDMRSSVRADIVLPEDLRVRHVVPTTGVTTHSASELSYRGDLIRDLTFGVVAEKL